MLEQILPHVLRERHLTGTQRTGCFFQREGKRGVDALLIRGIVVRLLGLVQQGQPDARQGQPFLQLLLRLGREGGIFSGQDGQGHE